MITDKFKQNKILSVVTGIIFMVVAIYTLSRPKEAISAFAIVFGAIILIKGFSHIFKFFNIGEAGEVNRIPKNSSVKRKPRNWRHYLNLFVGVILLVLGILLLLQIRILVEGMIYLIGGWLIVEGILGIIGAFNAKTEGGRSFLLVLSIVTLIGGIFVFLDHMIGIISVNIILGLTLLINGVRVILSPFIEKPQIDQQSPEI